MSSSMKAYLASKYMTGPKADAILAHQSAAEGKKKKKRKVVAASGTSSGTASFIKDEDEGREWAKPVDGEDDVEKEAVIEKDRSFKKRKVDASAGAAGGGGWITIREPTPPPAEDVIPDDEKPSIVDETPKLAGGLVTASQFRSTLPQAPKPSKQQRKEANEQQEETIYRDSTGRKIDTKAERAAAAREKRIQEEKEAQKMEWGKGLVQREEQERKKLEEEREKTRGLARYADDAELNAQQKEKDRWNDPAAAFLTKKEKKGPKRPAYNGPPPPPNRFGIKPGYRWDGVDRGNGFEKKLFQRANERKRGTLEAYQWSVDDM